MKSNLPDERARRVAFVFACANWVAWADDFEHGEPKTQPVLCDQERFKLFLSEFGVLRGKSKDERESYRQRLCGSEELKKAVEDSSGKEMERLSKKYGQQTSFLSKIAAFALPNRFTAIDEFARCGIAKVYPGKLHGRHDYESYLKDFLALEKCWRKELDADAQRYNLPDGISGEAFRLRLLDHWLMIKGGRWSRLITNN